MRRDVSVTMAAGRLFKVVNFSRKYRNTALQVAVHSPRIRFPRGESYLPFRPSFSPLLIFFSPMFVSRFTLTRSLTARIGFIRLFRKTRK